jgi:uncharacterized protein Yka (UPF0111/DUF47 family)
MFNAKEIIENLEALRRGLDQVRDEMEGLRKTMSIHRNQVEDILKEEMPAEIKKIKQYAQCIRGDVKDLRDVGSPINTGQIVHEVINVADLEADSEKAKIIANNVKEALADVKVIEKYRTEIDRVRRERECDNLEG